MHLRSSLVGLGVLLTSLMCGEAKAQRCLELGASCLHVHQLFVELTRVEFHLRRKADENKGTEPGYVSAAESLPLGLQVSGENCVVGDVDQYLRCNHRRYKRWKNQPAVVGCLPDLRALGELVHRMMDRRQLRPKVSGALTSGLVLGDVGSGSNFLGSPANGPGKTRPLGWVSVETKHFYDETQPLELSLGGEVGIFPVIKAVRVPGETSMQAVIQEAFMWDARAAGSWPRDVWGRGSELFFSFGGGQARLIDETAKLRRGANTVVALPIDNGSKSTWFWESGLEWRLYGSPSDDVHEEKSFLTPAMSIGARFRHDFRFRKAGDLAAFSRPTDRFLLSFGFRLPTFVRPKEGGPPTKYAIGFRVEREFGFGDLKIPSSTRVFITGDFNVVSILTQR